MIAFRRRSVTFVLMGLACGLAPDASPQSMSSPDLPWAGWAQCQITIQGPGYSHREAHLWTITGVATKQGSLETYPATWTVTGDGSLQRRNGDATLSAQWKLDGTVPNVEVGVTRHVNRITVQRWTGHGPARGALTGVETIQGTTRSRSIVLDVQQWSFPLVEDATTSTRITGSNTAPFDGARGPMAPGGAQGSAACAWDFSRGGQAGGNSQVAPLSQPNTATLNAPARSRATRATSSSGPASSSGTTSASTPTMTTTIVPSVLAVQQASAAPASESTTTTNATIKDPSAPTLIKGSPLPAPADVTASCNPDPNAPQCTVKWTLVSGATAYIVTHEVQSCTEWRPGNWGPFAGGGRYCAKWTVQNTELNAGGDASTLTISYDRFALANKFYVTATTLGGGLRSAPVEARWAF